MRLPLLASFLTLAVLVAPARGDEGAERRSITSPRDGFSLEVPKDWVIEQYGDALVRVTHGDLTLSVKAAAAGSTAPEGGVEWNVPGAKRATRVSGTPGTSVCRSSAFVERPTGAPLVLDATCPGDDAPGKQLLDAVVDSLDLTPFENPRTHADWTRGWTMDLPDGWVLAPVAGRPRFHAANGSAVLLVDAWDDLPLARNHRGIQGPEQWVELGVQSALEEKIGDAAIASHEEPEVAEMGLGAGREARLAGFRFQTAAQKESGEHGFASVLVSDRFRVVLLAAKEGSDASKAGFEALRSFEPDTVSALRGPKLDAFDKPDGPPVGFRLPKSWTKVTPKSSMRLGQWTLAGDPPAEVAVFWFGAGGGGGLAANMDRWKKMISGDDAPKTQEIEVAPGIKANVLDTKGTYSADVMPGSAEKVTIPDARLVAAVIDCPGGPLYVKAFGPRASMDPAADDLLAWIKSFRKR